MAASAPRWEFRTWFTLEETVVDPFGGWTFQDSSERTDRYLLLPDNSALLPKLRGNRRLDIKERIDIRNPLQLWRAAFGADFPLAADALEQATRLLGGPDPRPVPGTGLDGERFIATLRGLVPDLLTRTVSKQRLRHTRAALIGERTRVSVAETGVSAVTIAIEGPDPGALRDALVATGLAGRINRDYGTWLRATAGVPDD